MTSTLTAAARPMETKPQRPSGSGLRPSLRSTSLDLQASTTTTTLDLSPRLIPVPGLGREIGVKIASERAEWEAAFELVGQNYRNRGYEAADATGLRFTPYHALPDTNVFVAKHEGQVVATLSLVMDNTLLGLPMESIFGDEITKLRRANRHIAEVTSLADTHLGLREFVPVFVGLMRLMSQYFVSQDCDALVITVNPRHAAFYKKVMGFVPLGDVRDYPTVQNAPAEAYLLDVPLLRNNSPKMYDQIFGEPLPADVLLPRPMPTALVRTFAARSTQTNSREVTDLLAYVENYGNPRRWM